MKRFAGEADDSVRSHGAMGGHASAFRRAPEGVPRSSRAYLDTIELAARWTVYKASRAGEVAISIGGLALCPSSHAYEQGCCAYFRSADRQTPRLGPPPHMAGMGGCYDGGARAGGDDKHTTNGQARARWVADEMAVAARLAGVKEGIDPKRTMNPRALGGMS